MLRDCDPPARAELTEAIAFRTDFAAEHDCDGPCPGHELRCRRDEEIWRGTVMLVVSKSPLIVRRLDREGETWDQVLDGPRAAVDAIELQPTPEPGDDA